MIESSSLWNFEASNLVCMQNGGMLIRQCYTENLSCSRCHEKKISMNPRPWCLWHISLETIVIHATHYPSLGVGHIPQDKNRYKGHGQKDKLVAFNPNEFLWSIENFQYGSKQLQTEIRGLHISRLLWELYRAFDFVEIFALGRESLLYRYYTFWF